MLVDQKTLKQLISVGKSFYTGKSISLKYHLPFCVNIYGRQKYPGR